MQFPSNLVSDSPLIQDTFDFVVAAGGHAACSQIAEAVLRLANVGDELSVSLVADLIGNDSRFQLVGSSVSINQENPEARPLKEIEFVVLDVEAVAPRAAATRIIELAAYRVEKSEITGEFQALINPGVPLSPFIAQLTGLSNQALANAPSFADLAHRWLEFAGDAVLVAHNSDFDIPLLNQEIARVFPGKRMRNAEVCTVKLARRVIQNSGGHNLDALAEHLGFEIPDRHRAASDARATVRLLLHLLDALDGHGVRTLAEARTFKPAAKQTSQINAQLALDV